jgi:alkylhydroperoxidase/carboxymuconolactone decarboxylase family protein YurZ
MEEYRSRYVDLLGFVPPRIRARTDLLSRLDPELLARQESVRERAMYPDAFDTRTAQLMLFGMLLMDLAENTARLHAVAARRSGATWEEMSAVVGLAYLYRGLPAANLGAQIVHDLAEAEKPGPTDS